MATTPTTTLPAEQEAARIAALKRLQVLDTADEHAYDEIVRLAADICGTPIALISLVDDRRQWFKARMGLQARQTPREHAFCAHTLASSVPLVVRDALQDERFQHNPLVREDPSIRFYAGAPLVTTEGYNLGTVCVIDTVARDITPEQLAQLQFLSERVVTMLERHRLGSWLDEALEVGGVGLFTLDVATDTMYPTASCCALFGLPELPSYPASTFEALLVAEDRAVASTASTRRDGTAILSVEYRIARADTGELRYIHRAAQRRTDSSGQATHFLGALRDVTGERRAQLDARRREDELRLHSEGREFVIDLTSRQRALSDPGAVMRLTTQALGERLKVSRVGFYRVLAANAVQYLNGWSDGTLPMLSGLVDAAACGLAVAEHRTQGTALVFADSRHDLDGALMPMASQGTLAGIVVPLLSMQRWHAGLYVDSASVRAWSAAEVALVREVAELGWLAVERAEAMVRLQDRLGRQSAQLVQGHSELRDQKKARGAAEAQVRQLQKMESVGMLAGGIAHDFNNMLAVTLGALNLMERKFRRGDTDVHRHMEAALDATRRASTLTSRLLAFSRQQPLDPRPLDVNRLVGGMADLLTRTLGETVQLEVIQSAGLWLTHVDPGQLESVIVNLAVNARDAMPDGGRLTVEVANVNIDQAYATEHEIAEGHYIRVSVTDTGAGIPADILEKVFDPFFTTKGVGKGTGLGLSQAYGFARQSKGHIRVYSEVGHGTTFNLYLPRVFGQHEAAPARRPTTLNKDGAPDTVILVVEDEARMRTISVEALRDLGYTVLSAAGGAEALALLQAGQTISLLFTDIVMPEMSGRELADRVRKLLPSVPVLFTTGYTKNAVVHNGILDPGTNFLSKPFSIDELATKVAEALGNVR